MLKVFIDANIFFAAVKSSSGGSYFVLELAKKKKFRTITVGHVLSEAELNIKNKIGEKALLKHYQNLLNISPDTLSLVLMPKNLEEKLNSYVPGKDIPVLAGAILSGADMLLTLDKKHMLANKKLAELNLPFQIMTPGDFIQKILKT